MEPLIVGWGHTKFGRLDNHSLESLIQEAGRQALASAGISGAEIDAAWLGHFNAGMVPDGFPSSMLLSIDPALRFKPATRCENACASGAAALYAAIDAIRSGRVKIALVVGAEKMTHLSTPEVTRALGHAAYQPEEASLSFPDIFARFAQAYAATHTDPTRAMAHIAVKNHANALLNPLAHMHRELTLDFCLTESPKNPTISPPLKLTDCSPISDGAAAIILAASDLLPHFPHAVRFRAAQQVNDFLPLSAKNLAAFEGPTRAIAQAYQQANITHQDLSLAEIHDCFTIAELLTVEALGLAPPGKGTHPILDGATSRTGRLPINPSGGLKAKGHPVGATGISMHVLATRQLLHQADSLQLPNPTLALCLNMGGGAVASYASVLEAVK